MNRSSSWFVVLRIAAALTPVVSILALGQPAAAAPKEGDPRPVEARKACAAGNVERGVEILAEIVVENGDPNAIYNQGRCYQQNGRPEQAVARFREYLRVAKNITSGERAEVHGFIAELEAEIDARAKRRASAPAPRPADPFTAGAGADAGLDTGATTGSGPLRKAGYATLAVGALSLATGAFFTWRTLDTARQIEQHAGPASRDQIDGLLQRGRQAETLQWVGYGVGAAALIGAATLFYLDPPAPVAAARRRGGLAIVPVFDGKNAGVEVARSF